VKAKEKKIQWIRWIVKDRFARLIVRIRSKLYLRKICSIQKWYRDLKYSRVWRTIKKSVTVIQSLHRKKMAYSILKKKKLEKRMTFLQSR
jgi:hypothetical protein